MNILTLHSISPKLLSKRFTHSRYAPRNFRVSPQFLIKDIKTSIETIFQNQIYNVTGGIASKEIKAVDPGINGIKNKTGISERIM
jgi:hypothetical protein